LAEPGAGTSHQLGRERGDGAILGGLASCRSARIRTRLRDFDGNAASRLDPTQEAAAAGKLCHEHASPVDRRFDLDAIA
jgi:hypothetical protein